jgi:Ni,Fe-hydrogenase maturation factor
MGCGNAINGLDGAGLSVAESYTTSPIRGA